MSSFRDAITSGKLSEVETVLARDPSFASAPIEGAPSPILLAIYYGKANVADAIRQVKPELSLFEAAALGDLHAAEAVLSQKPDAFTEFSSDGFTALGYAAYFGNREMVRLLLSKGADPSVPSNNREAYPPLHSSLAGGHKEIARMLIDAGADVDASAANGYRPLHYCASSGDIESARFLIDAGAERDVYTDEGVSPFQMASDNGFSDLAELLRPLLL